MLCTELKLEMFCDNLVLLKKKLHTFILQMRRTYIYSFCETSFEGLCVHKKEKQDPLRGKKKVVLLFLGYF